MRNGTGKDRGTRRARRGDRVSIHYIGTLDNGRIFHRTDEGEPLSFLLGAGEVFPALEEAVAGMAPGEAKNLLIPAERAYGPRRRENVAVLGRGDLPAGTDPQVGQKLEMALVSGTRLRMRVVRVTAEEVTFDANHPLAGLDLIFALKLVAVG